MFGLGMSEIIFLAVLALIVIGPKELPQVARTLGRFLNELKRSSNILSEEIKQHTRMDLLDLEAPLARPKKVAKQAIQEELPKIEPEQMEFGDEKSAGHFDQPVDDAKEDEHKKS